MNHRIVAKYIGYIMLVEGLFMIPSVFVSLWFGEPDTLKAFLPAITIPLIGGFLLSRMKTAVAFANCRGGRILFGVSNSREVKGLDGDLFALRDSISDAVASSCSPPAT